MQVEVQELEPCKVALNIQIPPEQVAETLDSVFTQFARQTAVPGFRKGKAPRKLVERYIDTAMVRQVAVDRLWHEAYRQALDEKGLQPFAEPEVDVGEFREGEALSFTATVPLRPEVILGDLQGIEVTRVVVPITDADVDRDLERVRQSSAHYQDVEDAAQEGDRVLANVRVTIDGEIVEDGTAHSAWLIVGQNLPGFDAHVVGARAGETREFDFTYPPDYSDPARSGKEAHVVVEALRIQRRHVPELDDDFARSLGIDSVTELRQRVRESLEQQAQAQADEFLETELIQKVGERSTVQYPQSMVDEEVAGAMRRLISTLQSRNLTLEDYLSSKGKNLATLEAEFAQEGRRRIANTLLLNAIATHQGIAVTEQEVDEEIRQRAARIGTDPDVMRRVLVKQKELETVRNALFVRKVLDYLKSIAVIREGS